MSLLYSVVVPVMNEEGNINLMYERVKKTFEKINERFELIFVDDGSTDTSLEKMVKLSHEDERVKAIKLSRNFGHQIGVTAGIDHANGDAVIMIDGDLQDPPEFIEQFIKKFKEGYNVVYAVRKKRKGESWFKKVTASLFYRTLSKITKINIPLDTGDFRLIDRKVANSLVTIREKHRFIRGLTSWSGFKQTGIEYEREERYSGQTKYPLKKMLKFALDGITSFSFFPIKVCMFLGFLVGFLALVFGAFIIIKRLVYGQAIEEWASLMVAIMFLTGLQLFFLGIFGDYLGRIYDEVRDRPLYIVDRVYGFEKNNVKTDGKLYNQKPNELLISKEHVKESAENRLIGFSHPKSIKKFEEINKVEKDLDGSI
jgi:dolichol-phosphate mannosyltransferase